MEQYVYIFICWDTFRYSLFSSFMHTMYILNISVCANELVFSSIVLSINMLWIYLMLTVVAGEWGHN